MKLIKFALTKFGILITLDGQADFKNKFLKVILIQLYYGIESFLRHKLKLFHYDNLPKRMQEMKKYQ